jgi:hypothetical protein
MIERVVSKQGRRIRESRVAAPSQVLSPRDERIEGVVLARRRFVTTVRGEPRRPRAAGEAA